MHPASKKFPAVGKLSNEELETIVAGAPVNFLLRSSYEKDAKRELLRRRGEL